MTNNKNTTENRKPDFKLVQEKAYNKAGANEQLIRQSKLVDITVGWTEISQEGNEYISWADNFIPLLPDIDGRIKLVSFAIKSDNE